MVKLNIRAGSYHTILTEKLLVRRIPTKLVPRLLTTEQEIGPCEELLRRANINSNFLKHWWLNVDVRTRCANEGQTITMNQTNLSTALKARMNKSHVKVMLIVFLTGKGSSIWRRSTVNEAFYVNIMQRLREKMPAMWQNMSWMFRHDKERLHSSLVIREFLVKAPDICCPTTSLLSLLSPSWLLPLS